jgi:hypothetical protein
MPRPRLQQAATARQVKIQLPIAEQNFSLGGSVGIMRNISVTRGRPDTRCVWKPERKIFHT